MAVIRKNILTDSVVRDKFIRGVKLLKQEPSGRTTADFGIPGTRRSASTYDLFVIWHHTAMMRLTPAGNPAGRNAAHRGPIFGPWHRVMLMLLEQNLQRLLNDSAFGLPYWDWAEVGNLPVAQQKMADIWKANCMGGQGNPITTGPFAFRATDPASWRVLITANVSGDLVAENRGLRRNFAPPSAPSLPKSAHVTNALSLDTYDTSPWVSNSPGFRSRLEGWSADPPSRPPWLHNRVHVWVGGDMSPSTSPNDPIFYLNHCNADRAWERWLSQHRRVYVPNMSAGTGLKGHRIDDPIDSPLGRSATPRQVLNVSAIYSYDVLP